MPLQLELGSNACPQHHHFVSSEVLRNLPQVAQLLRSRVGIKPRPAGPYHSALHCSTQLLTKRPSPSFSHGNLSWPASSRTSFQTAAAITCRSTLHLCPGSSVLSRPPKITRPHSLTAQTSLVMPMRLNVPPSWGEWAFLFTHEIVMAERLVAFNPLLFKNILGRGESSTSFPPEKHTNTEH